MKLAEATLNAIVVAGRRPKDTTQHLCLDKGYDFREVEAACQARGYTLHLLHRGEEAQAKRTIPGYRARRWVVERTHSWLNRFRRILIRWEKKLENYTAMLHLACACIAFRSSGLPE
jgi:putative transposase